MGKLFDPNEICDDFDITLDDLNDIINEIEGIKAGYINRMDI